MSEEILGQFKLKIQDYTKEEIVFTKVNLLDWLCKRNNCSVSDLKNEFFSLTNLVYVEKQQIPHQGRIEERFRCYFVHSRTRGRCYVIKFEEVIKIITVFPLGRTTLKRYTRKFK